MNSNRIRYDVIYSDELYDLIILVNSMIKKKEGWKPLGGVVILSDEHYSDVLYHQTMIQKVEE